MNTLNTVRNSRLGAGLWTAVAALTLAAGIGVANAAPQAAGVPAISVRYDDLNMATRDGAVALYQRISLAARQVCPAPDSTSLDGIEAARSCRRAAIDRAVDSLHNAQLAALHSDVTHRG